MDYSISEEGVSDYETSVEGYNLTNTYTPEVVSVPFTKIWKDFDNQDGVRPNFIIVNLLANGKKVESRTVTATTAWTGSLIIFQNMKMVEKLSTPLRKKRCQIILQVLTKLTIS